MALPIQEHRLFLFINSNSEVITIQSLTGFQDNLALQQALEEVNSAGSQLSARPPQDPPLAAGQSFTHLAIDQSTYHFWDPVLEVAAPVVERLVQVAWFNHPSLAAQQAAPVENIWVLKSLGFPPHSGLAVATAQSFKQALS